MKREERLLFRLEKIRVDKCVGFYCFWFIMQLLQQDYGFEFYMIFICVLSCLLFLITLLSVICCASVCVVCVLSC